MQVRSHAALAISLMLLASAGVLALLVHDAAVGVPDEDQVRVGDSLRIRGDLRPVGDVAKTTAAAWFDSPDWAGAILILDADGREGDWVIEGTVQALTPWAEGLLLVLTPIAWDEPILTWT